MHGFEVIRRARGCQVPIVVLSARTDEAQKVRALEAGAEDYVTRPFGARELVARIRVVLRRDQARQTEAETLRAGALVLDLLRRRVTRSGREVHLTPTEFELLRVFVLNADRVLTRRFLLETAFGRDYADAHENLRTYIKLLRPKIEVEPSRPQLIVTEPGVGYSLRTGY